MQTCPLYSYVIKHNDLPAWGEGCVHHSTEELAECERCPEVAQQSRGHYWTGWSRQRGYLESVECEICDYTIGGLYRESASAEWRLTAPIDPADISDG